MLSIKFAAKLQDRDPWADRGRLNEHGYPQAVNTQTSNEGCRFLVGSRSDPQLHAFAELHVHRMSPLIVILIAPCLPQKRPARPITSEQAATSLMQAKQNPLTS
jgi:hypothetical protein